MPPLVALLLMAHAPSPDAKGLAIAQIVYEAERKPDGACYPLPVKETYVLTPAGLQYGAYFGNMPTNMNHNDSVTWPAGEKGNAVLETARRLANDPALGMKALGEHESTPNMGLDVYRVTVRLHSADSSRVVSDHSTQAWRELDAAFQALIADFERDTGRPMKPEQLSQSAAVPLEPAARATPVAEQALKRAYAAFRAKNKGAPAHDGPWLRGLQPKIEKDVRGTTTVTWTQFAPAGFEFEAVVALPPDGEPKVLKVSASYAAD
ncbi:MAG: hypothetical protein JST54_15945 [Deltaproteobacteria bacterium]|nr:hypothetical protein [Deltaproteobacteria bacterium]